MTKVHTVLVGLSRTALLIVLLVATHLSLSGGASRLISMRRGRRDQRGSLSTEQVVVTGVLLLLAIGVAGAIKLAVDGRIDQIK